MIYPRRREDLSVYANTSQLTTAISSVYRSSKSAATLNCVEYHDGAYFIVNPAVNSHVQQTINIRQRDVSEFESGDAQRSRNE